MPVGAEQAKQNGQGLNSPCLFHGEGGIPNLAVCWICNIIPLRSLFFCQMYLKLGRRFKSCWRWFEPAKGTRLKYFLCDINFLLSLKRTNTLHHGSQSSHFRLFRAEWGGGGEDILCCCDLQAPEHELPFLEQNIVYSFYILPFLTCKGADRASTHPKDRKLHQNKPVSQLPGFYPALT